MVKDWIDWIAKEYVGNRTIFGKDEYEAVQNEFKNYVKAHIKEMCDNCNIKKRHEEDVADEIVKQW